MGGGDPYPILLYKLYFDMLEHPNLYNKFVLDQPCM